MEIGFTDVGRDSFPGDVYVSRSAGLGGGMAASADLVGGVVWDSERFSGQSVHVGGRGGALGDFGRGTSFPDQSRSRLPNTSKSLTAPGGGVEAHIYRSNTKVWDAK